MVRFFLILMALAAMVWLGQHYFMHNPTGSAFWDSVGGHMDSSSPTPAEAGATATPADHTVKGCRTALEALSEKVLTPLDESKDFSATDAVRILQETRRDLGEYRFDPDYNHLMQACAMLGQALQERQGYMDRLQRDERTPHATPATSSLRTATLQPGTGIEANTMTTAEFFKETTLNEWNQRCNFYGSLIERLLTPTE